MPPAAGSSRRYHGRLLHRRSQRVLASQDPTLGRALCRLVHFMNDLAVEPVAVSQTHADAYLTALDAEEISKSPQTAWRAAVNAWNLAGARIEG